jgi:glyoxylase-like metal-dependent hydrolase (beta-lactamase superfamily II)
LFSPILLSAHNPGPMTGAGNNTYLLIAADGAALLIDAGVGEPRHLAQLGEAVDGADARLRDVLVTHGHADHASGAPAIAAAHSGAAFAKHPWPGQDELFAVDWHALADGERVQIGSDVLTALHTPGHSPDHLAFWHEASGTIFTGDLVVFGSSVMIHTSKGGDLSQYMDSLERLRALTPRVLLPAHGPRVDNPDALLSGYLEHRRLRERQVIAALEAGHATVEAVAESIYQGLDSVLMAAAYENVRAHLGKLKHDGVAFDEGDGRWQLQERPRWTR